MEKKEMSYEAKNFIGALKMLSHREGKREAEKELDEDARLMFELWHKEIYAECAKIYTTSKIREVKKQLLETAKKEIELLKKKQLKALDLFLGKVTYEEDRKIQEIEARMRYIMELDEEQLVEEIIKSLCVSSDYINTIKNRKEQMEQEKLKKLSYKGEKVVEENRIKSEPAKRILDEIKEKGLNKISKRVAETLNTNEQFVNLRAAENQATEIVIYEVAKIYRDKIAKIRMEIKEDLEKISNKYKKFTETDDLNLVRIKEQLKVDLEQAGLFTSKSKKEKLSNMISVIDGTLEHEKNLEEYKKRVSEFQMTPELESVFKQTTVYETINEHRKAIINRTGIIIDKISEDTIKLEAEQLKKEVKAKAQVINDSVTTVCTVEEQQLIEEFAETIGLSVKEAVNFLRNDNSMYTCLHAHIFGNEVLAKLDNSNAEEILYQIDQQWPYKRNRVVPEVQKLCGPKENTKPQIEDKQYQIRKIPPKK